MADLVSDDVEEDSSWRCNTCGMSGGCCSGDEEIALQVHDGLTHGGLR